MFTRGTPGNMQLLVGSMWFQTSLNAFSPSGVNGSGSTAAAVFNTSRLFQMPERSAWPSAVRGTGVPSGAAGVGRAAPAAAAIRTSHTGARANADPQTRERSSMRLMDLGPANTVWPFGSLHVPALQVLVPSFARQPSTVIILPLLQGVPRLQPCRVRLFGALPSHCHGVSVPLASSTSRVHPDVRVAPFDLRDRSGEHDRLVAVELGGEGMMSCRGSVQQAHTDDQDEGDQAVAHVVPRV